MSSIVLQYGGILCIAVLAGKIFSGKNPQRVLKLDELRDKPASEFDIGKIGGETHPDGNVNH